MKTGTKKYNFNFTVGSVITCIVILFAIIGFLHTPYDPNAMNASLKNMGPSLTHPFGNDNFGRDILSRVMDGAGTTFIIAIVIVTIGAVLGTILGAVTGYFGGWPDEILMRFNDGLTSFPSILLALVFVSIFGAGTYNIILALSIIFIPSFARVVRSEFILLKEMDFVKNAKLMGAGHLRIMFVHILPNTKQILLPSLLIGFNNAVISDLACSRRMPVWDECCPKHRRIYLMPLVCYCAGSHDCIYGARHQLDEWRCYR